MAKVECVKIECCAITSDLYQKQVKDRGKDIKCTRQARYQINDNFYCREHASFIVLKQFEEEGKVRRI